MVQAGGFEPPCCKEDKIPEDAMVPVREYPWAPGCPWTKCGPTMARRGLWGPCSGMQLNLASDQVGCRVTARRGTKHCALPGRESDEAEPDISSSHGPAALPFGR